jgi:hypothetical protein
MSVVQAMIRGLNHGSIGTPQGQTRGGQATVVEGRVCAVSVAGGVGIAAASSQVGV